MTISLIKEMFNRKTGAAYHPATEGPLAQCGEDSIRHMREGGIFDLSLSEAAFLVAQASGSLFEAAPLSGSIQAYGRIVDGAFVLHRFYFGSKWFLQAITDADGQLSGCLRIFSKLTEINPSSDDEWQAWVGKESLLRGRTIDWRGSAQYRRMWLPEAELVDPNQYREITALQQTSSDAMMFIRALSEARSEYLYLAVCRRSDGTRWVEAYVGLDIEPMEVMAI